MRSNSAGKNGDGFLWRELRQFFESLNGRIFYLPKSGPCKLKIVFLFKIIIRLFIWEGRWHCGIVNRHCNGFPVDGLVRRIYVKGSPYLVFIMGRTTD